MSKLGVHLGQSWALVSNKELTGSYTHSTNYSRIKESPTGECNLQYFGLYIKLIY